MTSVDALVIGAGPAGLSTSYALSQYGVSHLVVERGPCVGWTWSRLYDSLILHTARSLSALPGLAYPAGTPLFPTRADFVTYLHRYANTFRLPIETAVEIAAVRHKERGWVARTACGHEIQCRAIVMATGIISNPYIPDIPHRERFGGSCFHSVEYRRPDPFNGQRVLVVGAGNSAAEIAVELAHTGAAVTLAARSAIVSIPRRIAGLPTQYFALAAALLPRPMQRMATSAAAPASRPTCRTGPVIGSTLVTALRSGVIRLKSDVAQFTTGGMRFSDGSEEPFDAVILATGYHAALGLVDHLIQRDRCGFAMRRDGVASRDQPDLYFVGHTYDIRGALFNIARDSRRAARLIKASLGGRRQTSIGTPRRRSGTRWESSRRTIADPAV